MMSGESMAFLGPEGSYCDEAMHLFADRLNLEPEPVACSAFSEIFENVEGGRTAYGVVPVDNSLEGPVTAVLDSFAFDSRAVVLAEEVLSIHHCLLMADGADPASIDTIASHPQGLAQCRRFLDRRFAGAKRMTTTSTAESARIAAENPNVAGIASAYAAELYGVNVVETDIEDHAGNQTCFALIGAPGTTTPFSGKRYKTSLALFLKADKAGALLMILSEFAYAGINLTKIQSRPTKQGLGDYLFFVDLEGHVDDADVQTALSCLRMKLREVKVLGCFPIDRTEIA